MDVNEVGAELEKLEVDMVLVVTTSAAEEGLMSVLVKLEEYGVVPVLVITDPYEFEDPP